MCQLIKAPPAPPPFAAEPTHKHKATARRLQEAAGWDRPDQRRSHPVNQPLELTLPHAAAPWASAKAATSTARTCHGRRLRAAAAFGGEQPRGLCCNFRRGNRNASATPSHRRSSRLRGLNVGGDPQAPSIISGFMLLTRWRRKHPFRPNSKCKFSITDAEAASSSSCAGGAPHAMRASAM